MSPLWTIRLLRPWSAAWLQRQGSDTPQLDGDLLLADALGLRRIDLFLDPDRPLDPAELAAFKSRLRRRGQREPVAYILGRCSFWKETFRVAPAVLIPRPESEMLLETVLERFADREASLEILELGLGSGALLISLLREFANARGVGTDISEPALALARENGAALGVEGRLTCHQGDLTAPLDPGSRFDVIIANLPYVTSAEMAGLEPGVRDWEPHEALHGGADGLDLLARLPSLAAPFLNTEGMLALEIGQTQGPAVSGFLRDAGYRDVTVHRDYGRRPRVVAGFYGAVSDPVQADG